MTEKKQMKNRRGFLSFIKNIYIKPTANITLNGEKLKAFSLRSGPRQECSLTTSFNVGLEVLAYARRQEKKKKMYRLDRKK